MSLPVCALCGARNETVCQQDCGHFACEVCCYAVIDLETKIVRAFCAECGEEEGLS